MSNSWTGLVLPIGADAHVFNTINVQNISGIQINANNRRIFAEFQVSKDTTDNCKYQIQSAFVYLFSDYLAKPWKLELKTISFELMQGLSRVVQLIPEKLTTAIAINKEEMDDEDDDGRFLIYLVEKLLNFYMALARKMANPLQSEVQASNDPENVETIRVELGEPSQESFRYKLF